MKNFLIEFATQILVWGLLAFVIGVAAIIFAGTVSGVSVGTSPQASFGLTERFVCPAGGKILYEEGSESTYTDSDGLEHTGTNFSLSCVAPDGTKTEGVVGQAIIALLGLYFLGCFVPLFLPAILISWIIVHKIMGSILKKTL